MILVLLMRETWFHSTSVGRQTPRKLRLPSPYQGAETRRGHYAIVAQAEMLPVGSPQKKNTLKRVCFLLFFVEKSGTIIKN